MNKRQMRAKHRKMWQWIADHCHEYSERITVYHLKSLAFHDLKLEWATNDCFACEYCDIECEKCPCDWGKGINHCEDNGSCYMDFINSDNDEDKKKYALKVKNAWK